MEPRARARQNQAAIDAAVAAGVGHIAFVSAAGTCAAAEPSFWASYFAAEQRLMQTAPKWTILRMNYYAEALIDEARMCLAHGVLTGLAENKIAYVARDDLAAALVGLLTRDGHEGAIYNGTGRASITGAERAAAISNAAGKPLRFLILSHAELRASYEQMNLPAHIIDTAISIQEGFVVGGFDVVSGDIERLSGKPPRSFENILANAFAAS